MSKIMNLNLPILLFNIFFMYSCAKPGTAAPPKLPSPDTTRTTVADAALVWIMPFKEKDFVGTEKTGIWEEAAPVRSFWVAPVGNTWAVVAERTGLFVALGPRLTEVIIANYQHKMTELPAPTEQDSDALKECRDLMEGNSLTEGISAEGSGLILRDLGAGTKTPLLPPAASLEALDYPAGSMRYAKLLGGLGPYLFLHVSGYNQPCGLRSFDVDDFEILDLAQAVLVTLKFSGNAEQNTWKKYFDLPNRRQELEPMMKKQLLEYDNGIEYDAENLYVAHFYPVFPSSLATIGFQVAYRYWAGCRSCPSFDGYALAEELPPEMQEYATMHPAITAVRARLPKDWRIGGISLLSVPVAEGTRLRQLFDTSGR